MISAFKTRINEFEDNTSELILTVFQILIAFSKTVQLHVKSVRSQTQLAQMEQIPWLEAKMEG